MYFSVLTLYFLFQLRKLTVEGCQYRSIHQDLMRDLLRLSTSTYSQVSSSGHLSTSYQVIVSVSTLFIYSFAFCAFLLHIIPDYLLHIKD